MTRESKVESLKRDLEQSLRVIDQYSWLIDACVLDFYTEKENHWNRLPASWRLVFDNLEDVNLLADSLLNFDSPSSIQGPSIVLPLSLLTLRTLNQRLSATRKVLPVENRDSSPHKHLYKQVKQKKCHEIDRMAELCASTARKCNTKYIVDFGAGLGHLARILAFQYDIRVVCLEQQEKLSNEARILDERAKGIHQRDKSGRTIATPVHINFRLSSETDLQDLLQQIREAFGIPTSDDTFSFGLVGLHPCGDLAIILTNFFLQCENIKFLNIVGCCYMKLTTSGNPLVTCHPVSQYLKELKPAGLSYEAREIACHAIETYAERLRTNNYDYLKIHCYRALIERILCRYYPNMRHCGLKSVKQKDGLTFQEYARLVTTNCKDIEIPDEEFSTVDVEKDLAEWKKVVIFYTLRLFIAPLLETVILYDRMLWILEDQDCQCSLQATFDPILSPRNHVLIALRK